jgi:hypothetical protein
MFNDSTVRPGMSYSYKVSALTEKGEGPASVVVQIRIPAEEWHSDALGWMWVPAVVLVMAVVIIIMVRRARKGRQ